MAVIKEKRQFRTTPIGVVSSDRGTDRLYNSISAAADNVLGMAYKEGVRLAEKRGIETAQSMDEIKIRAIDPTTGKPEAMTFAPKSFGTVARDAYDRVINDRFRSSIENDIKIKGAEFSLKYENDPKSVEKYSLAMSEYVSEMSKNASGIYKPFIEETGKFYLASTKLKLTEKRMNIQRAQTAAYTTERIDTLGQQAYDMAASGADPEDVLKMIRKGADLAKDAEGANLFQAGSSNGVQDSLMAQAAQGTLANVLARPMTTRTRDAITLAITNGGKTIDRIPDQFKLDVAEIISLTNLNNRNDVLAFANGQIADYNASDAYTIAESARIAAQLTNVNLNQFGSALSDTFDLAAQSSNPAVFQGALDNITSSFQNQLAEIQQNFLNLDPAAQSNELLFSQQKNLRQQTINSVLLAAAKDGNVGQLQTAMSTGRTDILGLTEKQQAAVSFLYSNPEIYRPLEDGAFAGSILSGTQDDVAKRIEDNNFVINLQKSVIAMGDSIADGTANPEEAIALYSSLANTELLTPNQILDMQKSLRIAQGVGISNNEFSGKSSTELNAIALYLDTNGLDDRGLTPASKETADRILSGIEYQTDATSIVQHVNTMSNRASENESATKAITDAAILKANVISGAADSTEKKSRETSDAVILEMGYNLLDPSSVNADVYKIATRTLPESMLTGLRSVMNGQPTAGSDVLLQHYLNLSKIINPATGEEYNAFDQAGGLNTDETALLDTISLLTTNFTGTQNILEVAQKLKTAAGDPSIKAKLDQMFDGNYTKWATEKIGDVYAASKLLPYVKYMAVSGFSEKEIETQLNLQLDKVFVKTEGYIRDPRFPEEDYGRSEFALPRVIPDPEARSAFISVINQQLPAGYKVYSDREWTVEIIQAKKRKGVYWEEDMPNNRVVLVPDQMSGTNDVTYIAHIISSTGELKPLIYNSKPDGNGSWVMPSWDKSELKSFYENRQIAIDTEFTNEKGRISSTDVGKYGLRRTNPFGYYPPQPNSTQPQNTTTETNTQNPSDPVLKVAPKGMSELRYMNYLRNQNITLSDKDMKDAYAQYKNSPNY
jgi:hypothetical protein